MPKWLEPFVYALGFAIGASLMGMAIALVALPDGWVYLPIASASAGWTFGFTLGLAHQSNHSPTETMPTEEVPIVERKDNTDWVPDGVGGWLTLEKYEELQHGFPTRPEREKETQQETGTDQNQDYLEEHYNA